MNLDSGICKNMLELNGIRGRISILIEIGCGRLLEEEYLF